MSLNLRWGEVERGRIADLFVELVPVFLDELNGGEDDESEY